MRLNVFSELRQAIGGTTRYDLDEPGLNLDRDEFAAIHGTLTLLRTDRGLLATVAGEAEVSVSCSRCLVDAKNRVKIVFEEEYVPFRDPRTEALVQVESSEDCLRIDEEYRLDLSEGLRQYILTSGSSKPLCRSDCAGLCPECGADLNVRRCDCVKPVDSRWADLATFKSGNEGS